MTEERSAGNSHATFCGNRRRLTASDDPVLRGKLPWAARPGINIGVSDSGYIASNDQLTLFYAHAKRSIEAMDAKGVLPLFEGILCHDHWKPYYHYTGCLHSLCNAHHLRELECAYEQDGQQWAKAMQDLLLDILTDVKVQDTHALSAEKAKHYAGCYRNLLKQAEIECPPPDESRQSGQRGRANVVRRETC